MLVSEGVIRLDDFAVRGKVGAVMCLVLTAERKQLRSKGLECHLFEALLFETRHVKVVGYKRFSRLTAVIQDQTRQMAAPNAYADGSPPSYAMSHGRMMTPCKTKYRSNREI
mmetsp:Transcript_41635/g.111016  ORF Transcript_41635/g.111016 Transcript_41635/m.111016 type:complete len:112 (+) Transcript_41635:690-1025(+)